MRGSTRKRGSTWTAYWDGPADPETRERKQRSKGGFRTQKAAQAHLATVIVQTNEGGYVEPSKQPLARFVMDEWLPGVRATVRPNTWHAPTSACCVSTSLRRDVGALPLRSLTGGHLNALYAEMERDGLSVNTRRLLHSTLHRALRDAVRWGKLSRNPAASADPPSASRTRVESWSPQELRRFLEHVRGDRLYALWRLAATTGMRRGELLGISHQTLDLDSARLTRRSAASCQRRVRTAEVAPLRTDDRARRRDGRRTPPPRRGSEARAGPRRARIRGQRSPLLRRDRTAALPGDDLAPVRPAPQGRQGPRREPARSAAHGRDDRAHGHPSGAAARGRGKAWRRSENGPRHLCAPVAALGRDGCRCCRRRDR